MAGLVRMTSIYENSNAMGKKGGLARTQSLIAEQRSKIARKGAKPVGRSPGKQSRNGPSQTGLGPEAAL